MAASVPEWNIFPGAHDTGRPSDPEVRSPGTGRKLPRGDSVSPSRRWEPPLVLAFYLPQYHPIPENDEWWGRGFTEWRNVARARPQFRGHYQPHLPADLGYYDLRVPEVRAQQAELAAGAGVGGFVYYHYWFNGRRLLERPVDEVLASGEPRFPFCLAWANENWTRRWDGGDHEVLMAQHYSPDDDIAHIRALRGALTDDRYVTVQGKPVLLVYRSSLLPDSAATTDRWRREVESWGLPGLHLLRVESFRTETGDPRAAGFDAAVQFQPSWENIPPAPRWFRARQHLRRVDDRFSHRVFRYDDLADLAIAAPPKEYPRWPGVTPGFDNSSRRRHEATILVEPSPATYGRWLDVALERSETVADLLGCETPGLVFVNAWNEWAEGNHLEPDIRFGHAFLDATRRAVDRHRSRRAGASVGLRSGGTQ